MNWILVLGLASTNTEQLYIKESTFLHFLFLYIFFEIKDCPKSSWLTVSSKVGGQLTWDLLQVLWKGRAYRGLAWIYRLPPDRSVWTGVPDRKYGVTCSPYNKCCYQPIVITKISLRVTVGVMTILLLNEFDQSAILMVSYVICKASVRYQSHKNVYILRYWHICSKLLFLGHPV